MGELNSLERPLSAFIRLSEACPLGDLTEVPVATRFLYILLGPAGPDHVNVARYHEIGRAVATIMSDEVFHEVAYKVGLMMIRYHRLSVCVYRVGHHHVSDSDFACSNGMREFQLSQG